MSDQPRTGTASRFVLCPEKVTSPAPSPGALALGLTADMVCGERCTVTHEAPLMWMSCPRGHMFIVGPEAIEETP